MAFEFRLPDIGEGVAEGEIVRWFVAEGDTVTLDEPMVEVLTDKANVEIPAPRVRSAPFPLISPPTCTDARQEFYSPS